MGQETGGWGFYGEPTDPRTPRGSSEYGRWEGMGSGRWLIRSTVTHEPGPGNRCLLSEALAPEVPVISSR